VCRKKEAVRRNFGTGLDYGFYGCGAWSIVILYSQAPLVYVQSA